MNPGRWQWVVTAWAVCGQTCPTVSAELPVRCNLAVAIEALLDELVKLLMELQECGLPQRWSNCCGDGSLSMVYLLSRTGAI
jgi:hypothetical protein